MKKGIVCEGVSKILVRVFKSPCIPPARRYALPARSISVSSTLRGMFRYPQGVRADVRWQVQPASCADVTKQAKE